MTTTTRSARALLLAISALSASSAFAQSAQDAAADFYGSFSDYAQAGQQTLERRLHDRAGARASTGGAYAGYLYSDVNTNDDFDITSNNGYLGADFSATSALNLGLVLAGGSGETSMPGADGDVDGFQGLLYGTLKISEKLSGYATLGYGDYSYDSRRTTLFGTAFGSTDGYGYGASLGASYLALKRDNLSLTARAGLRYAASHVDGFTETGAVDSQIVDDLASKLLTLDLGSSALWNFTVAGNSLDLELVAAVEAPLVDNRDDVRAVFVNTPGSYTNSFDDETVSASLGGNVGYQLCDASRVFAGVEGRAGGNAGFYGNIGLRVQF